MENDRLAYYNPVLDPALQAAKMTPKMRTAVQNGTYDDGTVTNGGQLNTPDEHHPANLVSSLCEDGYHRPALDIDIPAIAVPSSTPGHCHIYFDVPLEWGAYVKLLDALVEAGILEQGYVAASKSRGQTLLRLPGVPKYGY